VPLYQSVTVILCQLGPRSRAWPDDQNFRSSLATPTIFGEPSGVNSALEYGNPLTVAGYRAGAGWDGIGAPLRAPDRRRRHRKAPEASGNCDALRWALA